MGLHQGGDQKICCDARPVRCRNPSAVGASGFRADDASQTFGINIRYAPAFKVYLSLHKSMRRIRPAADGENRPVEAIRSEIR